MHYCQFTSRQILHLLAFTSSQLKHLLINFSTLYHVVTSLEHQCSVVTIKSHNFINLSGSNKEKNFHLEKEATEKKGKIHFYDLRHHPTALLRRNFSEMKKKTYAFFAAAAKLTQQQQQQKRCNENRK